MKGTPCAGIPIASVSGLSTAAWKHVQSSYNLSSRQIEVLAALLETTSTKESARRLRAPHHAIRAHVAKLCRALNVESPRELIIAVLAVAANRQVAPNVAPEVDQPPAASLQLPVDALMAVKQAVCILATSHHFDIIAELLHRPLDVNSLAHAIEIRECTVSQNLSRLTVLGLVEYEKHGTRRVYRLGPSVKAQSRKNGVILTLTINGGCAVSLFVKAASDAIVVAQEGM